MSQTDLLGAAAAAAAAATIGGIRRCCTVTRGSADSDPVTNPDAAAVGRAAIDPFALGAAGLHGSSRGVAKIGNAHVCGSLESKATVGINHRARA